jgi:Zn-dependent peptidase ImmA (M78 family)
MAARTKYARQQARKLCERHGVTAPPVPVNRIAKALGIKVQYAPLDGGLSGMACIRDGVPIIGVNALHHPNRRRFTLAHELAHILLHRARLENEVHVDKATLRHESSIRVDDAEVEANAFASELLMPQAFLQTALAGRAIDLEDDTMIAALAKRFRVTETALRFRLHVAE